MIRVEMQPEPESFNEDVRVPGTSFLASCPRPSAAEWKSHSYWRDASGDLKKLYSNICAYSCHYIPDDTGFDTVEHYLSKNEHPCQAYEWINYRLVCGRLNGRKGRFTDVLDPFEVLDGWFVIDFPSLLIMPAEHLDADIKYSIEATILRLKLNDDETCLRARRSWVDAYCNPDPIPFDFLQRMAPFIARELARQNLVEEIRTIWIVPS